MFFSLKFSIQAVTLPFRQINQGQHHLQYSQDLQHHNLYPQRLSQDQPQHLLLHAEVIYIVYGLTANMARTDANRSALPILSNCTMLIIPRLNILSSCLYLSSCHLNCCSKIAEMFMILKRMVVSLIKEFLAIVQVWLHCFCNEDFELLFTDVVQ